MLFQLNGGNIAFQLLGLAVVFVALLALNEIAKRSKIGSIICFGALPIALTVYLIVVRIGTAKKAGWIFGNQTYLYTNGRLHYAMLYTAIIACIFIMLLENRLWLGKEKWFKALPVIAFIVPIIIAIIADFESAAQGAKALADTGTPWWLTSENVWLYGGWWNIVNAAAGIINILCLILLYIIYKPENPLNKPFGNTEWLFILAHGIWCFEFVYCSLTTHSWYCGIALLLAPVAAAIIKKGSWMQSRAYTLAIWCMLAQVVPAFMENGKFAVIPRLYADGYMDTTIHPSGADPKAQTVLAVISITTNATLLVYIIIKAILDKRKKSA